MERNVDKIKRLEHELGRYRKKVADQARETEKLRQKMADADAGSAQLSAMVDAVLTAVALEYGLHVTDEEASGEELGWRLSLPLVDVAELRRRYEIHARKNASGGVTIGVMERVTQQLMLDTLQVTLHQEFGFGYDRIKRLTDAWGKTYNQFHDALDGGTEADYWQEKLDRLLLDLLRDHQALIPFGERYPEIREITYGPRRAGKG